MAEIIAILLAQFILITLVDIFNNYFTENKEALK